MINYVGTGRRTETGEVLPSDPAFTNWIARVNSGACFQLDFRDELCGPDGEPLLRLPLTREGEDGYTFGELALYLYNRSIGALLTPAENATGIVDADTDSFPLSFGDIVDFLQTGMLLDRVPLTPPWGYPEATHTDVTIEPLNFITLPICTRRQIAWLFGKIGVTNLGVSLVRTAHGLQTYWISFQTEEMLSPETFQTVSNRVCWYLPRYSAVVVEYVEEGPVRGYGLRPSDPETDEADNETDT